MIDPEAGGAAGHAPVSERDQSASEILESVERGHSARANPFEVIRPEPELELTIGALAAALELALATARHPAAMATEPTGSTTLLNRRTGGLRDATD